MVKAKTLCYSTVLTFIFAVFGGIAVCFGISELEQIKNSFSDFPTVIFPIVWVLLYLLMSFSAAIIYDSSDESIAKAPRALFLYVIQLAVSFWWYVLFFGFRLYAVSFIWLLLLILIVVCMTVLFARINKSAGLIQIFYLVCLFFTAYINAAILFN